MHGDFNKRDPRERSDTRVHGPDSAPFVRAMLALQPNTLRLHRPRGFCYLRFGTCICGPQNQERRTAMKVSALLALALAVASIAPASAAPIKVAAKPSDGPSV